MCWGPIAFHAEPTGRHNLNKIFYQWSPNLTSTVHIHSPTERGMHQVHRFTPPEIIQLFSRLGRKFHSISFNFRIFLPPSHKKYSAYRLQISHAQCTFTPLRSEACTKCTALPPRNYSTFFAARSKISHNFLQFPNLSTPLTQKIFYLSSPNLTGCACLAA